MDVRSNAAHGRRAASAFLSRLLNFGLLAVLGVAGLVWSDQAQAQSCDFLAVGANSAAGPVNSQVNFQIIAATACNATVDIQISIDAGDTTGGATIAANGLSTFSTTITRDVPFDFGIVLGPNGGGDGSVTVTCVTGCFSNPPVTYTFQTNNLFNYTAIGGVTNVVANQITPFTVGTNYLLNGSPGVQSTGFFNSTTLTNYGSVAPDGAGNASTTQSIFTAGSYIVTGNIICPTAFFLEGCPPPTVNFNVEIEPVAVTAVTPLNPSVVAGTPLAMTVAYGSTSIPAADGTVMNWSVTAQPAGGDGSVTGANVVGGESDATFNATVPGTYTVTANSGCTFCAPGLLSFNVTVTGAPTLAISGGDGQTTLINTPYALPLEVTAQNGGLPAGGVTIDWLVTGGAAIISPSGPTDFTGGMASASVTPTVGGPISIIASRADAPGVEVTFNLVSTLPPSTLTAVSANPATGTVGVAQDFTVRLEQGGSPLVGATIDWSATAPFSPSTSSSVTDAAGETTVSFTPASAGSFTGAVTALYNPDGIVGNADDVSLFFDATVAAVPTLAITSGDGQTSPVGTAFALPLVVTAEDSGVPAGGINIGWVVTSGNATLVASGPTAAADGQASATVTPTGAGPVVVTATRSDAPSATVTFNLTATALPYTLTPVSANPASGTVGVATAFTVRLDQGGTPVNAANIQWSAGAPFAPASAAGATDAAGEATASFTPSAAGSFAGAVTALYDPDGVPANGDEVTFAFDVGVAAVPTLVINGGDGQTTPVGSNFPAVLSVIAEDSGVPAVGLTIDWLVTGGTANVTPSGPTDAVGEAHLSVTPTSAGPITITATRSDAPSATVTFNLTATALPYTLTPVSANPASGTVGVATAFTVRLDQGGTPVNAANIQWSAGAPFAPASAAGATDAAGEATASFTPSAAGSFAGAVTALYDPDGVPANGDEVTFAFDVGVAAVPTLAITSGDGQTSPVGTAFALPLVVTAEDSGVPAGGINIGWVVTSGNATLVASGPTAAADGQASATVTPTGAGSVVVTATRSDAPSATVTFNLTATALPYTLTPVSANPASGTVGVATAFTVRLDQGGTPVNAANIQWSAGAPFAPASAAGATDAAGEATASFTPSAAGSFAGAVTALYDPDGVPANGDEVTFAFDANVAAVPTLAISSGNGQAATIGTPLGAPLVVLAENSGVAAVGVNITWAVTAGTATVVAGGATDATGLASATVTPTSVGPITITATRADAPTETVTFNVTGNALPFSLGAISANPANGTVGVPLPLTVRLLQGGSPVAGASIQWTAGAPFAPATSASSTNAAGDASASFTPSSFGSFAGAITATFDPDGVPANGDELSVSFDADIAFVASLAITGGNGQNALVGAGFALPLQVNAQNSGTAAAGVTINWTVTGDATLVAGGATDAAGDASATVTAGATPGAITITASRQDDPWDPLESTCRHASLSIL